MADEKNQDEIAELEHMAAAQEHDVPDVPDVAEVEVVEYGDR